MIQKLWEIIGFAPILGAFFGIVICALIWLTSQAVHGDLSMDIFIWGQPIIYGTAYLHTLFWLWKFDSELSEKTGERKR